MWIQAYRETLMSGWVMSNLCSSPFVLGSEACLQCPFSPYTLNFVPQSSVFHLSFQSFIKSTFISVHHPCPVFTSLLFSSLPCSIDSVLVYTIAPLFKGSAHYVPWQCHLLVTCVGTKKKKNLIALSFHFSDLLLSLTHSLSLSLCSSFFTHFNKLVVVGNVGGVFKSVFVCVCYAYA